MYGYLKKKKKESGELAPAVFPQLWKSVQVTEPLDQHQKIRHLAQEEEKPTKNKPGVHTILLKVIFTSVLCLKITKTGMDDWTAASR